MTVVLTSAVVGLLFFVLGTAYGAHLATSQPRTQVQALNAAVNQTRVELDALTAARRAELDVQRSIAAEVWPATVTRLDQRSAHQTLLKGD